MNPAAGRLADVLGSSGAHGNVVDWAELERETGLRLPADYRDFVAVFGGGELNEYLAVRVPPAEGLPDGLLLEGLGFDPRDAPPSEGEAGVEELSEEGRLLPFATTANGDVAFWICDSLDPESWDVAVFRRQVPYGTEPWRRYGMGFGEFLAGALDGTLPNPFSDGSWNLPPHEFRNLRQG
ncbi:SMI1/KNR4 family protein [Kitasatospora sp. NPDC097605]|uniref:SMI1/KNR4 family protein n=1 Tax=Kitasatospora sp. NPDC097605 TaxID=3157226 RepID=UPI00332FB59B